MIALGYFKLELEVGGALYSALSRFVFDLVVVRIVLFGREQG
jgi:hypothetical protein